MKHLSDTELIRIGREIARLLPLCYREMAEHFDPWTLLQYTTQIAKSEYTLQQLRIEWKRRNP